MAVVSWGGNIYRGLAADIKPSGADGDIYMETDTGKFCIYGNTSWVAGMGVINTLQATPSDPTGTTSSAGLMMGLGGSFIPVKSGTILILISGNIANNTLGDGGKVQIRYGTGTAPINGAALTGTTAGALAQILNPLLALLVPGSGNFTCNGIVSGLTLSTPYWIDVSLGRLVGGTATISNISISIIEL